MGIRKGQIGTEVGVGGSEWKQHMLSSLITNYYAVTVICAQATARTDYCYALHRAGTLLKDCWETAVSSKGNCQSAARNQMVGAYLASAEELYWLLIHSECNSSTERTDSSPPHSSLRMGSTDGICSCIQSPARELGRRHFLVWHINMALYVPVRVRTLQPAIKNTPILQNVWSPAVVGSV